MKKISNLFIIFIFLACLIPSFTRADTGFIFPYFTVPHGNPRFCIEVLPIFDHDGDTPRIKSNVVLYEFSSTDSQGKPLAEMMKKVKWKMEILYPKSVHLTNCGKYMIAQRPLSLHKERYKESPLLEFYSEGKTIKKITLADIGIDHNTYSRDLAIQGDDDVIWDLRIIDKTDDKFPTHEELELFKNPGEAGDDIFGSKFSDGLLYVAVQNRAYYFHLSDGQLAFKKLIKKNDK